MRRLLFTLIAVICLAAAPSLGVAASNTRPLPGRVNAATPSDAQIDATIRAKLTKSKIGKDGFRFRVSHGVVTWEGSTEVAQHKGSATRMARTAGALQVVNNIQVSAAGKAKAGASLKRATVQQ